LTTLHRLTLTAIAAVAAQMLFASAAGAVSLAEINQTVKQMRENEAKLAQQREAAATRKLQEQESSHVTRWRVATRPRPAATP
jgi:hypothetical protein